MRRKQQTMTALAQCLYNFDVRPFNPIFSFRRFFKTRNFFEETRGKVVRINTDLERLVFMLDMDTNYYNEFCSGTIEQLREYHKLTVRLSRQFRKSPLRILFPVEVLKFIGLLDQVSEYSNDAIVRRTLQDDQEFHQMVANLPIV
jgi:hypothetical protein